VQGQQRNLDVPKLQACIKAQDDSAVKASLHEGDSIGVSATPTLFVNGEEMDGALPIAELRAVLDRALTQAGVQPPVHAEAAPAPAGPSPTAK
jgi:protein-disulfide isomerase